MVLNRAGDYLWYSPLEHPTHSRDEFNGVGHMQIDENKIGHLTPAAFKPVRRVTCLDNFEFETLEDSPRDLSNRGGMINDKTVFH